MAHYTTTLTANNGTEITISTTLTSHPGVARDWLHSILRQTFIPRHRLVIGLGVQWTPDTYYRNNSAATIQLCIGKNCLIFHLTHVTSCPRILRRVLSDPRITFVGLWNSQDSAKLSQSRHRLELVNGMPIDLRHHLEEDYGTGIRGASIEVIAEEVLGIVLNRSEEISRSNWDAEDLCLRQIYQATAKAFVSFAVGMRICAWNLNPNF